MGSRFRRLIRPGTIVRLAFSFALALVVWGFVVWETNPERTRTESDVAVTPINVPDDMRIVGSVEPVTITMKGPQDVINAMTSASVSATVDLANVSTTGISEYEVAVSTPDGLREVIVEPREVEVELDAYVSRSYPIQLIEPDTRPTNVADIDLSAENAEVQGSQSVVDEVDSVGAVVEIGDEIESFTDEFSLVALDSDGEEVPDVSIEPTTVEVEVTFRTTERFAPVSVVCSCIEDGNLEIREFEEAAAIPSTVRVSGPEELLSEITSIPTQPVDVSGLTSAGWILDVELDLSNINSEIDVDETTVDVWVPIEQQRLTFDEIDIEAINVPEGYRAVVSPSDASFSVGGSPDALEDFEGTTPSAIVDVDGRESGIYRLEVRILLPSGLAYDDVEPGEVDATITRVSTPNAEDEPTPPRETTFPLSRR